MLEVLTIVALGVVGLTILAAAVYIVGFLVSIVASLFTVPYEIKRHHDSASPI